MNRDKMLEVLWAHSCGGLTLANYGLLFFLPILKCINYVFKVHQGLIGLKMYDLISCQFTTILLPCINANRRAIEWGRPGNKAETTAV